MPSRATGGNSVGRTPSVDISAVVKVRTAASIAPLKENTMMMSSSFRGMSLRNFNTSPSAFASKV